MPNVPLSTPPPAFYPRHQNMRAINVNVPDEVYWHVRRCATASRMSLKEYMTAFCRQAQPLVPGTAK